MNEKKVLKAILDDCADGYGVFDVEELNTVVPKLTQKQLRALVKHLEVNGFISIKYSDEKSFCLAPLQKAKQMFEKQSKRSWLKFLMMFLVAFLGSFLGSTLAGLIF